MLEVGRGGVGRDVRWVCVLGREFYSYSYVFRKGNKGFGDVSMFLRFGKRV